MVQQLDENWHQVGIDHWLDGRPILDGKQASKSNQSQQLDSNILLKDHFAQFLEILDLQKSVSQKRTYIKFDFVSEVGDERLEIEIIGLLVVQRLLNGELGDIRQVLVGSLALSSVLRVEHASPPLLELLPIQIW